MHTHDDAIAALVKRGIPASRREWALGDTIVFPLGHPSASGAITTYPTVAWLVPGVDDSWNLEQVVAGLSRTRTYPDLDAACRAVVETAEAFALVQRCERCGQSAQMAFGEHTGGGFLDYWVAWRCIACGAQVESDGIGPLPDELRDLEIKRNGAWTLSIQPPLAPAQWAAVRNALELDLAGLGALKRALPGPIFCGTVGETIRLRNALLQNGVIADMREAR